MKRSIAAAVLILITALLLSSCSLGDALLGAMGFDTHDYESEEVIEILPTDGEEVEELRDMIGLLTINDPDLPEFSSSGEALDVCRDAILNYLLCNGFAKYRGNNDLRKQVEEEYPQLKIISVIPSEDFENCVYTYFGGNAKVSHRDSEMFIYLESARAYTAVSVPVENEVKVEATLCEKTENTTRFVFRCSLGDKISPEYRAIVVNRKDGSSYFKSLVVNGNN